MPTSVLVMEGNCVTSDPGQLQHLLVVENNPGDTRLIEEAFREADLEATIHAVSTGKGALDFVYGRGEYSDSPTPDVVLLDWSLPRMDGGDVLSELKGDFPDLPVIVMTGSRSLKNAIESETSLADAYLTKPSEPDGYIDTIRSVC